MFRSVFIFFIIFLLLLWAVYYFDMAENVSESGTGQNSYEVNLREALERNTKLYDVAFSLDTGGGARRNASVKNSDIQGLTVYTPESIGDSSKYPSLDSASLPGSREYNTSIERKTPSLNAGIIGSEKSGGLTEKNNNGKNTGNFGTPEIPGYNAQVDISSGKCDGGIIFDPCLVLGTPVPPPSTMDFGVPERSL